MPLNELIARIKRGEPGIDAVVWKDGFNDWEPIEEVPELKSYRKHAPPPRKKIKSKPTSAIGSSYSAQTTNPSISQSQLQPALSQSQLQPNLNSGYRAMGSPQDTMAAGASQPPNSALLQQFQKSNQNKLVIALLAGFGAIAVLGLLYFVYNLGKEGSKQTPSDKKIANKLNNSAASNENQKTTKKPVTTNTTKPKETEDKVVYILATDQNENNDDDKNHKKSSNGKSSKSKPASSNTSSNSGKSSSSSSSSRSRSRSRSRSDLKKTMATNKSRISRCYAITVRKGQSSLVDHSVKVHLKIKPSGKVSSISFSGGIPPIMKNCLVRNLRSFKFPKGSKNDSFTYTMHFSN
jgi:hypothetical protein